MATQSLTSEEKVILLKLARQTLEAEVRGDPIRPLNLDEFSPALLADGTSFVTLTKNGQLRGCIGALEPTQALVADVRDHTIAAVTKDYRFPNVNPYELDEISIEISRLTPAQPLAYADDKDLIQKLRPGIDGVVLKDGFRRATFLPQVWEKLSDPEVFLGQLCVKMGNPMKAWKQKKMEVLIYQVEEFHEE
jgi:uncharacterized protein